jgi:hypothetical protein
VIGLVVDKNEILETPEKILKDKNKLKEVISDPELTVCLLEAQGKYEQTVEVDGEPIKLYRPHISPQMMNMVRIFL